MDELEELTYSECRALLAGGVFGRVALCTPKGAAILPVNYSVVGEAVIFRTSADGVVGTSGGNRRWPSRSITSTTTNVRVGVWWPLDVL